MTISMREVVGQILQGRDRNPETTNTNEIVNSIFQAVEAGVFDNPMDNPEAWNSLSQEERHIYTMGRTLATADDDGSISADERQSFMQTLGSFERISHRGAFTGSSSQKPATSPERRGFGDYVMEFLSALTS